MDIAALEFGRAGDQAVGRQSVIGVEFGELAVLEQESVFAEPEVDAVADEQLSLVGKPLDVLLRGALLDVCYLLVEALFALGRPEVLRRPRVATRRRRAACRRRRTRWRGPLRFAS